MWIGPVTLEGHHVRLEPVSLAHVPALWRVGTHEEIWRYLPYAMHSEEEMRAYVESELAKQQWLRSALHHGRQGDCPARGLDQLPQHRPAPPPSGDWRHLDHPVLATLSHQH